MPFKNTFLLQVFVSKCFCLWDKKLKWLCWQHSPSCISQGIKSTFEKEKQCVLCGFGNDGRFYIMYGRLYYILMRAQPLQHFFQGIISNLQMYCFYSRILAGLRLYWMSTFPCELICINPFLKMKWLDNSDPE